MTPKFQNRLAGMIVLVCLGTIILPDLFDGEKQRYQNNFAAIPLRTPLKNERKQVEPIKMPVQLDEQPLLRPAVENHADLAQKKALSQAEKSVIAKANAAPKNNSAANLASAKASQTAQVEPAKPGFNDSAWMIRLGVFSQQDNAARLANTLRSQGYPASTRPWPVSSGKTLVLVQVGPGTSEQKMRAMLQEIHSNNKGLQGQVLRFDPLK
ncbi:MAG: SPOR domain-containing protein [Vibrionaceae bacterium]